MYRGMVVGVWFGVIDMAVMFWSIICVISFYQQLEEHEFGMFKKTKRALWNFDLGKIESSPITPILHSLTFVCI